MSNITLNAHDPGTHIGGSLKAACQYCAENRATFGTVVTRQPESISARLTKLVPEHGGEWDEFSKLWKWPNGSTLVVSEPGGGVDIEMLAEDEAS